MQNGFCESFNGRMRDELLNETLFLGLAHAKEKSPSGRMTSTPASAFRAWLSDPGGPCRQSHRNRRVAAQP